MIDFSINESQKMILKSLQDTLEKKVDFKLLNDKAEKKSDYKYGWNELLELGYISMLTEENSGGYGLSFFDFCLMLEKWGYNLCDGPIIENSVSGILTLQNFEQEKFQTLINQLSNSEKILTSTILEQYIQEKSFPIISKVNGEIQLSGKLSNVSFYKESTHIMMIAKSNQKKRVVIIPSDSFEILETKTSLIGEEICDLEISDFHIEEKNLVGINHKINNIIDFMYYHTIISKCSESIGVAEHILNITLDYVKNREQFNNKIGSFQTVQHNLSEMYISINETRELIRYAAKEKYSGEFKKLSLFCKIICDEKISQIAWSAHQLHGAIGFTWDYGLHLLTKKILINKNLGGNISFHSNKIF
jgi:alkylation response protein AidB-like acyl-CoA dehydrogenase